VEECTGEARERLSVGLVTCTASGIARREHHPVRVELELRDLGGREKAVILLRRSCGRRQKQRGLRPGCCEHRGLPSQQAVRRKMPDPRLRDNALGGQSLVALLGAPLAEIARALAAPARCCNGAYLVGRPRQWVLGTDLLYAANPAAKKLR